MSARTAIARPRPCHLSRALRKRQRGASIVTAIFFLLLFAGLALYMQWTSTAAHRGSAQDVQGARAYQAARSGVEWGLYRLLRDGVCVSDDLTFTAGTSLSEFTASVSCRRTDDDTDELGNRVCVYEIEATACNRPVGGSCANIPASGGDYHERQIRVSTEYLKIDGSSPDTCPLPS